MVDFRYHLVSIIAVFLALAVGIVLGATAIEGPFFDSISSQVGSLTKDRDALRAQTDELAKRVEDQAKFAKAVLPFAISGRLTGERVLLVSTPDAAGAVRDDAARAVEAAGAVVAGRVTLTAQFADPTRVETLGAVAARAVNGSPSGEGSPLQLAANQLATALATPTRDGAPGLNAETDRIVSLFREAELLTVEGERPARSSIVVVVVPLPVVSASPGNDERVRTVNEVIGAFARQAAVVVAVTPTGGAADGGALSSLRRDRALATDVSSVDHADTPAGHAAVVLSIVERLRATPDEAGVRRAAGHYGEGPGADQSLPDLVAVS